MAELTEINTTDNEARLNETSSNEVTVLERLGPVVAMLAVGSWVGVLVRIALQLFYELDLYSVFPALYANLIGCLIIGVAFRQKRTLQLWYYPSFAGLTTGLAGSITTFSSWSTSASLVATRYTRPDLTGAGRFVDWLSVLVIGLAVSVAGYQFGQILGDETLYTNTTNDNQANKPAVKVERVTDWRFSRADLLVMGTTLVMFAGTIVAAAVVQDSNAISLSVVLAPLGTLLRWQLGAILNQPRFPFGTLTSNILGSSFAIGFTLIQVLVSTSTGVCLLLQGLITGFCGCLTTVSTFIVELYALPKKTAILYCLISIIFAQTIQLLIAGIVYDVYDNRFEAACVQL